MAKALDEDRAFAYEKGQPSAAISASSAKIKLYGLNVLDNAQKGTARSAELERLLAISGGGND